MASKFSYAAATRTRDSVSHTTDVVEAFGYPMSGVICGLLVYFWDIWAPNVLKLLVLVFLGLNPPKRFRVRTKLYAVVPVLSCFLGHTVSSWGPTAIYVSFVAAAAVVLGIIDSHDYSRDPPERKAVRIMVILMTYVLITLTLLHTWNTVIAHIFRLLHKGDPLKIISFLALIAAMSGFVRLLHDDVSISDNVECYRLWFKDRSWRVTLDVMETTEKWITSFKRLPLYRYGELRHSREIRLLRLRKTSPFSSMIKGTLIHVDVDSAPPYEAISYTWSQDDYSREIAVDNARFSVSAGLYELLRARHSSIEERLIWVDYICIDQCSVIDKAQQIPIMRDIYRSASRTIIWLGGPYDAKLAAEMLDKLMRLFDRRDSNVINTSYDIGHQHDRPRWLALVRLLEHRYFSRVWVCQEVAVSRCPVLHYGDIYFPWDSIVRLLRTISEHGFEDFFTYDRLGEDWNPESFDNAQVLGFLRTAVTEGAELPLGFVLSHTYDFKSTRKEDRIFALLGLAPPADHPDINQYIAKAATEVFTETARSLLLSPKNSIHLLPLAGVGYMRLPEAKDLPSWCPDWISGRSGRRFSIPYLPDSSHLDYSPAGGLGYRAAGSSGPQIRLGHIPGSILLRGVRFDVIKKTTTVLKPGPGLKNQVSVDMACILATSSIENFVTEAHRLAIFYARSHTEEDLRTAFWRTLIANRTRHQLPAPSVYRLYYEIWREMSPVNVPHPNPSNLANLKVLFQLLSGEDPPDRWALPFYRRLSAASEDFGEAFARAACMKRFCVTEGGHMGFVAPGSEVGDIVCIIFGMQTPYTLRMASRNKCSSSATPVYQLVGECYIHGAMNGEVMGSGNEDSFIVV
jgi:hypothetical protein